MYILTCKHSFCHQSNKWINFICFLQKRNNHQGNNTLGAVAPLFYTESWQNDILSSNNRFGLWVCFICTCLVKTFSVAAGTESTGQVHRNMKLFALWWTDSWCHKSQESVFKKKSSASWSCKGSCSKLISCWWWVWQWFQYLVWRQRDLEGGTNLQKLKLKPLHSSRRFDLPWTCVTAGLSVVIYFFSFISLRYADVEAFGFSAVLWS